MREVWEGVSEAGSVLPPAPWSCPRTWKQLAQGLRCPSAIRRPQIYSCPLPSIRPQGKTATNSIQRRMKVLTSSGRSETEDDRMCWEQSLGVGQAWAWLWLYHTPPFPSEPQILCL